MVLWVGRINKDIVKENQDEFVQVLTEKSVHHIHELGRALVTPNGMTKNS